MTRNTAPLPCGKKNYQRLLRGILLLLLGFTWIALEQALHGFGVLGLIISPITVVLGWAIEFFARMYSDQQNL